MNQSIKNINATYNKTFSGGKSTGTPVELEYKGTAVNCRVCGENEYKEYSGTIGRSKVRALAGMFFFGDLIDTLDNSSILLYTCITCGTARIVKDGKRRQITASPI
jgi:predicted RNA-binding Zn-ribbon protein involved in translation (DUF1610 family)